MEGAAGPIVASAVGWIGALLIQEANTLFEVSDKVQSLKEDLQVMQQYLRDADAKQKVREVHALIGQIKKLAYDAEDVIDTYILRVEAKVNVQAHRNWFRKLAWLLRNTHHVYRVGKEIQVIQNNMKRIEDKLNGFGVRRVIELGENLRSSSCNERYLRKKPQSYPYDDDGEYIVGLEKDVSKLVEILMGDGNHHVNIISIVGMGGSGKTTLAKKLYNHPYSKECFDCSAWVFISQEWSTKHVLSEILRKIGGPTETTELNAKSSKEELMDKLRQILEEKSYLVVLDDVWRKEALEQILPALPRPNNKKGSKIVITTRNQEVFQFEHLQKHLYVHMAKRLSEEDAWELFSKIAFYHCTNNEIESFKDLGIEMLKKCDGLPLAIVALAGILGTKRSIREWQQVREAVRSKLMESKGSHMYGRVGDMLALSYNDLPYDLKPCFLYLGIFPEDCQIATGMLTRMWMAEGVVIAHGDMSLEDRAVQIIEELSNRFMIQVVRKNFMGEIKVIRMHDLLREFCVKKAKEESFLEIYTSVTHLFTNDESTCAIQPRRASLHSCVSFPTHAPNLRSLVLLTRSSISHSAYANKVALDLYAVHKSFKMLKVLNIWGIETVARTLPSQIGSLVHLRYLGIQQTNITQLPMSVGSLRNLLTLDYRNVDCNDDEPIRIPDVLCKLIRLRHLFLPVDCPWDIEDLQLWPLENLQTLWGIKLDTTSNWLSRQVQQLSQSVKKLKIFVSRQTELDVIFDCPSLVHDRLHTLQCHMDNGTALQRGKPLCHNQHLHKLVLIGEIQMHLPLLLPTNLVVLELKDSNLKDVDPMVVLGALTHLKVLRLSNTYQGTSFTCETSSFPQLEELYLENLVNLETWRINMGAFQCLEKLKIVRCTKLQDFPEGLSDITSLKQVECFEMPLTFLTKASEYGYGLSEEKRWIPHNCEALLKLCDSRIDTSSVRKLYEQLSAGLFLNNKTMRYWVVEQPHCCYNCFMICAKGLSLARYDRVDALWEVDRDNWEWNEMSERDGTMVEVVKLKWVQLHQQQYQGLIRVPLLRVRGQFSVAYLSPNVRYKFSCVIMLDGSLSRKEVSKSLSREKVSRSLSRTKVWAESTFTLLDGTVQSQHKQLDDVQTDEWIQVLVGELDVSPESACYEEVKFSLNIGIESVNGIAIKGVLIEPKL